MDRVGIHQAIIISSRIFSDILEWHSRSMAAKALRYVGQISRGRGDRYGEAKVVGGSRETGRNA